MAKKNPRLNSDAIERACRSYVIKLTRRALKDAHVSIGKAGIEVVDGGDYFDVGPVSVNMCVPWSKVIKATLWPEMFDGTPDEMNETANGFDERAEQLERVARRFRAVAAEIRKVSAAVASGSAE